MIFMHYSQYKFTLTWLTLRQVVINSFKHGIIQHKSYFSLNT